MSAALKTQTPKEYEDDFFANFTAVQEKNGMIGSICVVGISSDENEDKGECQDEGDDDEKGGEESKENEKGSKEKFHTREQLAGLRYILVNKSREEMLKKANKFATCNQAGDYCQMYNTHTGNKTILGIPKQTKSAMRQKTAPLQFDALFALTLALKEVEVWIEDNEFYDEGGECEMAIKELASAWKKLLSKSNEELGIDAEFTRPGIERFWTSSRSGHLGFILTTSSTGDPREPENKQLQRFKKWTKPWFLLSTVWSVMVDYLRRSEIVV